MNKIFIFLLAFVFSPALFAQAEDIEKEETIEDDAMEKQVTEAMADSANPLRLDPKLTAGLARTCFVFKDSANRQWVYLRLRPSQSTMVRLKSGASLRSAEVRIALTPRQRLALRFALNLSKPVPKITLVVKYTSLSYSKNLKGRYLVRRLEYLLPLVEGKNVVTESAEPPDKPSAFSF